VPVVPIAKEGYRYIAVLAAITIILGIFLSPYWSIVPGTLTMFTAFFFRNPDRTVPEDQTLILSPADGTVMNIEEIIEDAFLNGPAIKVSIFLSIFDVHINRSPLQGTIVFQRYICGRFKPAYKQSAPTLNEQLTIGLQSSRVNILVTQIAGIIARRIVCWSALGSELQRGQRYGMIKFGSCTELVMPAHVDIQIVKGDHVIGGRTAIAKISEIPSS